MPVSSELGKSLVSIRQRLKQWEREFTDTHNRAPSQTDVDQSPSMKHLYAEYYSLKSAVSQSSRSKFSSGYTPVCNLTRQEINNNAASVVIPTAPPPILATKHPANQSFSKSQCIPNFHSFFGTNSTFSDKASPPSLDTSLNSNYSSENHTKNALNSMSNAEENLHSTSARKVAPKSSKSDGKKQKVVSNNFVKTDLRNKNRSSAHRQKFGGIGNKVVKKWIPKKTWARQQRTQKQQMLKDALYDELVSEESDDLEVILDESEPDLNHYQPPNNEIKLDDLQSQLQMIFGLKEFREGQRESISLVLEKKSALVVLATGAGKSLIYQLSAALLPGVAIIVSPLLSLMEDQVKSLPKSIVGEVWSSQQSIEEISSLKSRLKQGMVKILFVSPERMFTAGFSDVIESLPDPGVSFVCIDEAHCVSEWSHNFRPCFSRIKEMVDSLKIKCIVALTATATRKTVQSICRNLHIEPQNVVETTVERENLILSVSRDHDVHKGLLSLLQRDPFQNMKGIIIYVMKQHTADEISRFLQLNGYDCLSYHSGKSSELRRSIQESFMSGNLRIIVATIAFGMGINKENVRAVIHLNVPRSFEQYVQEIGRAGRDGQIAFCHLFFNEEDAVRNRSLVHSDGVDEEQIQQLVEYIFNTSSDGIVNLSIDKLEKKWDIKGVVIETLLTIASKEFPDQLELLPNIHGSCVISFHKTEPRQLANLNPLIHQILSCCKLQKEGKLICKLDKTANSIGCNIHYLQRELIRLRKSGELHLDWRDWGFCVRVKKGERNLDRITSKISLLFNEHEKVLFDKVNLVGQVMKSIAVEMVDNLHEYQSTTESNQFLHQAILNYFSNEDDFSHSKLLQLAESRIPDYERLDSILSPDNVPGFLKSDIKVFLSGNPSIKSGREVARIFHAIGSPRFPAADWNKNPFWGKHTYFTFNTVKDVAESILSYDDDG